MRLSVKDPERCIGCQNCMFACNRTKNLAGLSKACIGIKSLGGMEKGFTIMVCRACIDPPCMRVCPTKALILREDGGVKLNIKKCIGCRNCKKSCLLNAIFWDEENNKPLICIHCGYCVKFCPHEVLKLEKDKDCYA